MRSFHSMLAWALCCPSVVLSASLKANDPPRIMRTMEVKPSGYLQVSSKSDAAADNDAGVFSNASLDNTFFKATRSPCSAQPSKKQQLKGTILESMCESLGNANFLVFGTGFDSEFWVKSNPGGNTRFLESHESWVSFQPEEVKDVVTVVNYTTRFEEAMTQISDEHILKEFYDKQVPGDVKSTHWNQILVDGPEGFRGGPGRGQSIYAAMKLAGPDTVIYVDDCGRQVEQGYIKKYLQDGREMEDFSNGHAGRTCKLAKPGDGWLQKTWKSVLR